MYQLNDHFQASDTNRQPYSFSVERRTETDNLHAWVQDNSFHLACIGNRHILNTPAFLRGRFEMTFRFNYMEVMEPGFSVLFQYDEAKRRGLGIKFVYDLHKSIRATLLEADSTRMTALSTRTLALDSPLLESSYSFVLCIEEDGIHGSIANVPYSFSCPAKKGKLAIERHTYLGELIIDSVQFSTPDSFSSECVVNEVTAAVPCINGGDIPYTIAWRIDRTEGEYYLTARLDGGTRTRPVNREDRPGQYVAEQDWMTTPYIGLVCGEVRALYRIADGERGFIDPNIFWDCQKALLGDTELPLENTYKIPAHLIGPDTEVFFGYENLFCSGYAAQAGGCEFRYTLQGQLIDFGPAPDGQDIFEVHSQPDKLALTFVPQDCYDRQRVVEHIKNNHYFDVSEAPRFTLEVQTQVTPDYLDAEAAILNVYENRTLHRLQPYLSVQPERYGYHILCFSVTVPQMEVGVWKVEFTVRYGGKPYRRIIKTFEVFDKDTDQNPALASGLPFVFSMPNEHKWLASNSFDLWSQVRSCDVEHYITCITDTPLEAERRRSWQLTKPFKRKWFAWLGSRTCLGWQAENHPEVVKNADYLFCSWNEKEPDLGVSSLYPFRQDHFSYATFMSRAADRLPILDDFLADNPAVAQKLDYVPGSGIFTKEHFIQLMRTCAADWMSYQNERGLALLQAQGKELRRINPGFRRACYGPINCYVTPSLTAHSLQVYGIGNSATLSTDYFSGFAVFEDYPYSCGYQTWRGAFMVMQLLLEAPGLTLYPEQYKDSRGGCIDGAVKNAHAPMGKYDLAAYQNATHAFEFVFNTPYLLPDGFHYWSTYGFHRSDYTSDFMNSLVLDWRYAVENKPQKPLRSMAFLAQYSQLEDRFEVFEVNAEQYSCHLINRSEQGHGLIYECSRQTGVPAGFALKPESMDALSAELCDVLVLPDLTDAAPAVLEKLRSLYHAGVNLIAVSVVDGLEDLFGVAKAPHPTEISRIFYGRKSECVRPGRPMLTYKPAGAYTVLQTETGDPLALATSRTLLLNAAVTDLGCEDSPATTASKGLHIVGNLVRRMLCDEIRRLSAPLALGENVGVTLFETQDGRTELLAIDYTPFDNTVQGPHQAVIRLDLPDAIGVQCDREIFVGKLNGIVKELRFDILPHESVFVCLHRDNADC